MSILIQKKKDTIVTTYCDPKALLSIVAICVIVTIISVAVFLIIFDALVSDHIKENWNDNQKQIFYESVKFAKLIIYTAISLLLVLYFATH